MNRAYPTVDGSSQLSLSISDNQLTLTGPLWSFRWAAPEVLESGDKSTQEADVFAFGVVVIEVCPWTFQHSNAWKDNH